MSRYILSFALYLALALPAAAGTACPDDREIRAMADDILAGAATTPPPVDTLESGLCVQERLVELLSEVWGEPIGYKVALTSGAAQETFGTSEPVRGILLADMILEPGARVPAAYAARPRYEADFVAVVGDAGINDATSPVEVLANLSSLHPFIELADLVVADPGALDSARITAINAGARLGILGAEIDLMEPDAMVDALAEMTVTVTDQHGAELARAPGSALLGQPLRAVLWLLDNGVTLEEGDLVSLGSFGPLLTPEPGLTATVTYHGLPGTPEVSVSFR